MQTTTYTETLPDTHTLRLKEKREFIEKLKKAISANDKLGKAFHLRINPLKTGTYARDQWNMSDDGEWDVRSTHVPIHSEGPRKTSLLDRFVQNIDKTYKQSINKEILGDMLEEAKKDLDTLEAASSDELDRIETVRKTLTIIYRKGQVQPNNFPNARLENYHWELMTKFQPWDQIGENGQLVVHPEESRGKVRLVYEEATGCIISNVVDISSVIKRQAGAAKRKPYVFGHQDPEFIARCKGVAGRILRLCQPRKRGPVPITADRFSMRVFQDRVSRLPEHLDLNIVQLVNLCEHQLSTRRARQEDVNYIKMIEFVEPTIHLNPDARRRELKEIASGSKVKLILEPVAQARESSSDEDSDDGNTTDSSYVSDSEEPLTIDLAGKDQQRVRQAAAPNNKTASHGGLNKSDIEKVLAANEVQTSGLGTAALRERLQRLIAGTLHREDFIVA